MHQGPQVHTRSSAASLHHALCAESHLRFHDNPTRSRPSPAAVSVAVTTPKGHRAMEVQLAPSRETLTHRGGRVVALLSFQSSNVISQEGSKVLNFLRSKPLIPVPEEHRRSKTLSNLRCATQSKSVFWTTRRSSDQTQTCLVESDMKPSRGFTSGWFWWFWF